MGDEDHTALIDVVTASHRYSGRLVSRGYRVADVLCDTQTDIVQMFDVVVTSAGGSSSIRCGDLLLTKEQILLALPRGGHEAPARRLNKFTRQDQYQAIVVVPGHILSGLIHLPPRTTSATLLAKDVSLPNFLAMTQVTVHDGPGGLMPAACPVALIRRAMISAVELGPAFAPSLSTNRNDEITVVSGR